MQQITFIPLVNKLCFLNVSCNHLQNDCQLIQKGRKERWKRQKKKK